MMKLFAWVAFLVAIFAGAGLAATEPGLVQIVVVIGALAALIYDIAKDKIPNRDAVVVAVALPSLIVGMNGGIPNTLERWLDSLWGLWGDEAGSALGTGSMLVVAVIAVVVAFVFSRSSPGSGTMSTPGMRR
jgi:hypothetical protein